MLRLRFHEDMTQAEIGLRVGCSQMHVSRILRAALGRLRLLEQGAPPAPAARATRVVAVKHNDSSELARTLAA